MTVGLFVPCYVDQLCPEAAVAALELLEKHGCEVRVPEGQTCCGQPLANAGLGSRADGATRHFGRLFAGFDYVVSPSASCVHYVTHHALGGRAAETDAGDDAAGNGARAAGEVASGRADMAGRIFELCEFLADVLGVTRVASTFPHRVGLHASCHGVRGLRLASGTERAVPAFDKVRALLESVGGLDLVPLDRPDACCGFGGTFSVAEPAVSVAMGRERLDDHVRRGAEVITGTDVSCLLHLDGVARRLGLPVRTAHVAQILNGGPW